MKHVLKNISNNSYQIRSMVHPFKHKIQSWNSIYNRTNVFWDNQTTTNDTYKQMNTYF